MENNLFVENLYVPIFKICLNILVDDNIYLALKKLKRTDGLGKLDLLSCDAMFYISRSKNWNLVFTNSKINSEILAHESLHAVKAILESKSVPFNNDTEEVYAYLLGFIVTELSLILKDYLK